MSRTVRVEKPSVLPYYGAAAAALILSVLFPVYKLPFLLITLAGSAAVFVLLKKLCPPVVTETELPFNTGVGDADEMLASMSALLDRLHAINETVPDAALTDAMNRMEKAGRGIVQAVEEKPEKAKEARRFANHYLPDAVKVLEQYAKLLANGVKGENATAIRQEVESNAASIATAFENQQDALYASENLDLSVDIEVLQSMMKGQGL